MRFPGKGERGREAARPVNPFGRGRPWVRWTWALCKFTNYVQRWKPNERGLVFATRNGTPWDANLLVKRKLYALLDSLGIERSGLHVFRHANTTLMDRLGVPLRVRQRRLGHSDPTLTLSVYTDIASEDDARFVAQLDDILRPNAPKKKTA